MPRTPPQPMKTHVVVWDPQFQTWRRATGNDLEWFALEVARVQHLLRHGFDSSNGSGDPLTRLPIDHVRAKLASLTGVLKCAKRKWDEARRG